MFHEEDLAAGEVSPRLGEEARDLQWEVHGSVEGLVKAVVAAECVVKEQRRGPGLAMAATHRCRLHTYDAAGELSAWVRSG